MAGWLPGLRALHENNRIGVGQAVLTHGSVIPFKQYTTCDSDVVLPLNVTQACACWSGELSDSLAGHFMTGIRAAQDLSDRLYRNPTKSSSHLDRDLNSDASRLVSADVGN